MITIRTTDGVATFLVLLLMTGVAAITLLVLVLSDWPSSPRHVDHAAPHDWETVAVTCERERRDWERLARSCATRYREVGMACDRSPYYTPFGQDEEATP